MKRLKALEKKKKGGFLKATPQSEISVIIRSALHRVKAAE